MKQHPKWLVILFTGLTAWSSYCAADVLLIDRVESKAGLTLPSKSQTMTQVQAQFGEPSSQSGPVGEPPITKWTYPEFVVYFEHSHVITAVVKKSKDTEIGPKSVEQDSSPKDDSQDN